MNRDLPTMAASAYSSSTYDTDRLFAEAPMQQNNDAFVALMRRAGNNPFAGVAGDPAPQRGAIAMPNPTRRVAKVIIADTYDSVPLDQCVLYMGEEKVTDATDQELFFELDIRALLATHNEKRVKLVDKKVKDRIEYLEPAKVRDLKMVVVTVATL